MITSTNLSSIFRCTYLPCPELRDLASHPHSYLHSQFLTSVSTLVSSSVLKLFLLFFYEIIKSSQMKMKPVKKTSSSILEEFVGRKLKFVNCQNSILKEIVGRTLKFVTCQSTTNLETFCFKSMISRSMPGENIFNLNNRFCCSSYLSLP